MKIFKVLGSGCANCVNTAKLIENTADAEGVEVKVEKITDVETIMNYGVMSTPAVICDEKIIHSGGVPSVEVIRTWF